MSYYALFLLSFSHHVSIITAAVHQHASRDVSLRRELSEVHRKVSSIKQKKEAKPKSAKSLAKSGKSGSNTRVPVSNQRRDTRLVAAIHGWGAVLSIR